MHVQAGVAHIVVKSPTSGREHLDEIKQHIKNRHDKLFSLFKHCVTFNTFCSSLHEVADESFTSTVKTRLHEGSIIY